MLNKKVLKKGFHLLVISENTVRGYTYDTSYTCSRSRRRAEKVDKRMVLVHTHGLFIT